MKTRRLKRAPSGERASIAEKWIDRALNSSFQFTQGFLRGQGWLVVPVESGLHFDEQDAQRLARAASLFGKTKLRAVLLEKLEKVRDHLEVDATTEGLLLFSRECAHFNFTLLPDDHSFSVICTTHDYFLVAGSKRFVETATGMEVAEARADFEDFATDDSWSKPDRARLVDISHRYREKGA